MAKITKNFTTDEMKCPCCNNCEMDVEFMANLQRIREQCGFGFRINSAYRCAEYNAKVSKNTKGQHATGQAVDVSMKDRYKRYEILMKAIYAEYLKILQFQKHLYILEKEMLKMGLAFIRK